MQYKILPPPIQGLNLRDHPAHLGEFQALSLHNFYIKNTKILKRLGYRQLGNSFGSDEVGMELVNFVDGSGVAHILAFTDKYVREYNSDTNVWDVINPLVDSEARPFTGDKTNRFSWAVVADMASAWPSIIALVVTNGIDLPLYYTGSDRFVEFDPDTDEFEDFQYAKEVDSHYDHMLFYNYTTTKAYSRSVRWTALGRVTGADSNGDYPWSSGTHGEVFIAALKGRVMRVKPLRNQRIIYSDNGIAIQSYIGGDFIYRFDEAINEIGLLAEKALWDFSLYHFFLGTDQKIYLYGGGSELQNAGDILGSALTDRLAFDKLYSCIFSFNRNSNRLYCFYARAEGDSTDEYGTSYFSLNMNMNPPAWEEGRFTHGVRDFSIYDSQVDYRCNGILFNNYTLWETGIDYEIGDFVLAANTKFYVAAEKHTSGVFADDLAPTPPDTPKWTETTIHVIAADPLSIGCDDAIYSEWACGDASFRSDYPLPVFITGDAKVMILDELSGVDDTESISCKYETRDIVIQDGTQIQFFRPVEISINCSKQRRPGVDNAINVRYSIDQGATWTTFAQSPIILTEEFKTHKLEFEDVKTRQVRIEITDASIGDVQISDMILHYQPSTIRE